MKVLKFGGTSVGSVKNMANVKNIINDGSKKVVVLSAMSGTTNTLVSIATAISKGDSNEALNMIQQLQDQYIITVDELLTDKILHTRTKTYVLKIFDTLKNTSKKTYSIDLENLILAQGELLSTYMFNAFLEASGISSALLPALDFMRINADKDPDLLAIKEQLNNVMQAAPAVDIYITQGFICLDEQQRITNLQRGGSDYTATIIGAAIQAEEVQIWTDIDGIHHNDPRYVADTRPIADLSFDEAAELAYFGAKILHPQTVLPVRADGIPVRLKNTMNPKAYGTLISNKVSDTGIKAIAAKDHIVAIKIKSGRMLQAYGFLKKIFEVFETYETAIDMITTSEVAVSLTIDDDTRLDAILSKLKNFASIEVDRQQTIVCIVGHGVVNHDATFKLFQILKDVKIRMISYGGSRNNISLLVHADDKVKTLNKLHAYCFSTE